MVYYTDNEKISELEQRLKQIKEEESKSPKATVWQRLDDSLSRMTDEQLRYVNTDKESITKKQELNVLFTDWLFERYKSDFVSIPMFEQKAQEYVDSILKASEEFSAKRANMQQENELLRSEVEELRKVKEELEELKRRTL